MVAVALKRWLCALVVCLAPAVAAASLKLHPAGSQIDLLLIGYAVFQTNLAEDSRGFFDSGDQLPPEFSNRQVLNLRLDGKLSAGTTLEARLLHDKESLRDWRWHMALRGARSLLEIGEVEGAFQDTQFLRYDTPYYGFQGHMGLGKLTTSAFGTTRDGSYRIDRLRGTNLSGPYILSASPVLEGSERVAIEIRDRRDVEKVLSSDAKQRGQDYSIDYPTGTIQFDEPIETETFDGNPVVVVIEYQYELGPGEETRYIGGARMQVQPWKSLRLATTWMRSTGSGTEALSRQGLVGFDHTLALGQTLGFESELAGPVGDPLDRREGAIRLNGSLRPLAGLEIAGHFRRVGDQYDTTANPRLDTELDRQDWELDTSFLALPALRLVGGYGVRSDNVGGQNEQGTTSTTTWFAGVESRIRRSSMLRLRYENRLTDGAGAAGGRESATDTITFDGESKLGRLGFLGESMVRAQYRYETIDESGEADHNRNSHYLKARLDAKPTSIFAAYLEWRETRTHGEADSPIQAATHEILGGTLVRIGRKLNAGASLRWRQNVDSLDQTASSTRTTAILDARWEPSERFRALIKYEQTLLESGASGGASSSTRNLFGLLAWKPVADLTLSLGSKLDDRGEELSSAGGLDGEWFASLLYKRGERLTLFARAEQGLSEERLPPFDTTRSERQTWIAGAQYALGAGWATMAEWKDERLTGATLGRRRAIVGELQRSLGRHLTLAGGVELAVESEGDTSELDRERVYLKVIGRL